MHTARLFLDGSWHNGESITHVPDKFTGQPVTAMHVASKEQVTTATRALAKAQRRINLSAYERYTILAGAAELLGTRRAEFVDAVVTDTGFTLADAEREVDRAAETLLLSGEEAKRLTGEMVPVAAAPEAPERLAFTIRRPLGVVCAITPFNSPLNTVAHKVGPAIAAGNAVVLKPAAMTPFTASKVVQLLLDAGLPAELIAVVHGPGSTVGQWLLDDDVPAFYAFTGSTEVGAHVRQAAGLRRTQLEMGSLSSTVICADADLPRAAERAVSAAFRKAGQVCTSVQRLYVEQDALATFVALLQDTLASRAAGDPRQPGTFVGPVISPSDAERIQSWIGRAVDTGAEVVTGGRRTGNVLEPTVLTGVAADAEIMCQEVFGPVVSIRPFTDLDHALTEVDDTPFGLAAGIFTANLDRALRAATSLRMGAIHINETSSSRVDLQPYGGVKLSGLGVEGPRYALREMTEECLVTVGSSR